MSDEEDFDSPEWDDEEFLDDEEGDPSPEEVPEEWSDDFKEEVPEQPRGAPDLPASVQAFVAASRPEKVAMIKEAATAKVAVAKATVKKVLGVVKKVVKPTKASKTKARIGAKISSAVTKLRVKRAAR